MRTDAQIDRRERLLRAIAVAGGVIGAAWGIQWMLRAGEPFGREGGVQLLFSFVMTVAFAGRAMGRRTERWFWANVTVLSAIWVWRSELKGYPLGVVAFSISAGLSVVGIVVATRQKRGAQGSGSSS